MGAEDLRGDIDGLMENRTVGELLHGLFDRYSAEIGETSKILHDPFATQSLGRVTEGVIEEYVDLTTVVGVLGKVVPQLAEFFQNTVWEVLEKTGIDLDRELDLDLKKLSKKQLESLHVVLLRVFGDEVMVRDDRGWRERLIAERGEELDALPAYIVDWLGDDANARDGKAGTIHEGKRYINLTAFRSLVYPSAGSPNRKEFPVTQVNTRTSSVDKFKAIEVVESKKEILGTEKVLEVSVVIGLLDKMHEKGYVRLVPPGSTGELSEGAERLLEDVVRVGGEQDARSFLKERGIMTETGSSEVFDRIFGTRAKLGMGRTRQKIVKTIYGMGEEGSGEFMTDKEVAQQLARDELRVSLDEVTEVRKATLSKMFATS